MLIFDLTRIADNNDFRARIRYLMVKAALAKLVAATPPAEDILLGQRILDDGESVAAWATAALTNATIAAGAHAADGSTIVDPDLEFAINNFWPAFAK